MGILSLYYTRYVQQYMPLAMLSVLYLRSLRMMLAPPFFLVVFMLVCQADDIFHSAGSAEQHTPGWTKAVVVGQVRTISINITVVSYRHHPGVCCGVVILWCYGVKV